MAKAPYQPPEQSKFGQLIDTLFLLALVVASLFAPRLLRPRRRRQDRPRASPTRRWAGHGSERHHAGAVGEARLHAGDGGTTSIASRFDYSFSMPALVVTALVVIVYFVFVFRLSRRNTATSSPNALTGKESATMGNLNNFQLLEYAAWGISALLGLWMLFDMIAHRPDLRGDLLISSKGRRDRRRARHRSYRTKGGTGEPVQQQFTARRSRCCASSARPCLGARRRHRARRRVHGLELRGRQGRRARRADRLLDRRPALHLRRHDRLAR